MTTASGAGGRRPYYEAPDLTLWNCDVREGLQALPATSIQTIVTSPPYWAQRSYDAGPLEIGHEPTPDLFVAVLVGAFAEARRVLRDDGTCWIVIGDCFAGGGTGNQGGTGQRVGRSHTQRRVLRKDQAPGIKPKDLVGVPFRLALALQADGWWLRSVVIWHKPNAMPESVQSRPTVAHEYVLLLAKSEQYAYYPDAIAEPAVSTHGSGNGYARPQQLRRGGRGSDRPYPSWAERRASGEPLRRGDPALSGYVNHGAGVGGGGISRNARSVWTIATVPLHGPHFAAFPPELAERCILAGSRPGDLVADIFAGTGTTLAVARAFGRRAVGIELNESYCRMAVRRIEEQTPALPLEATS